MKLYLKVLIFGVLILPASIYPQNHSQQIAVLDLDPIGVSQAESQTLTDRFRSELVNTGRFTVIERAEMDEILKEQAFQQTGCTTDACAVEIGKLLNVRRIVAGSIGKIGRVYTISLRVIDVESGVIVSTFTEDCPCPLEKVLTSSMKKIAEKMAAGGTAGFSSGAALTGEGDIYLKSQPSAAEIFVDGKPAGLNTPATIRNVAAGEHLIKLTKGDYVGSKVVNVLPNDITETTVFLSKARGGLKIYSDPPEASIFIEEKSYGQTPRVIKDLPAGEYLVTLRKSGYLDLKKPVKVSGETFASIDGKLIKPAALRITSDPSGAEVIIRGEKKGTAPVTLNNLYPERFYVEVSASGYKSERRYITLREAYRSEEHFALKKLPTLMVNSNPSGARVYVNGNFKGMTPLKLEGIGEEKVKVEVRKKYYLDWVRDLSLVAGQDAQLQAKLEMQQGELSIESTPTGANVWINNTSVGVTPCQVRLPYGEYELISRAKGYSDFKETVVLDQPVIKKRLTLKLKLGLARLSAVPAGAHIFVDGRKQTGEQSEFRLPVGRHEIKIKRSGYLGRSFAVDIKADRTATINGALRRKTRGTALLRSLFIPGLGQAYQEKGGRAIVYPLLFAGAAAGSYFIGVKGHEKAVDDYNAARQAYLTAFDPADINSSRETMHRAYDDVSSAENTRNALFIAAGAIWLWNVIDAAILPPGYEKHLHLSAAGSSAGIGMQVSFGLR